jgi:hypothetical protein
MAPKHSKQSRLHSNKKVLKRPACAPSSSAQGGTAQSDPENVLGEQAALPSTMDYRAFKLALQSPQAQENNIAHFAQAVKDLNNIRTRGKCSPNWSWPTKARASPTPCSRPTTSSAQ